MMKAHKKKLIMGVVLGLALAARAIPTWAGYTALREVIIDTYNLSSTQVIYRVAGAVSAARYSSDNQQYIGCSLYGTASAPSVSCAARDKNGVEFSCATTDPNMAKIVRAMTNYSFLVLEVPSGGDTCSSIAVYDLSEGIK